MQIGMIGLGRMGANLTRRLLRDGHDVVVYDVDEQSVARLAAEGAASAADLGDLAARLTAPRAVWVMVPAGITGRVIGDLASQLEPGDIVIDGGNSFYQDDLERSATLAERGIHLLDVGTSGGVLGLDRGFCLMIGGDDEAVAHLDPVFRSLAPGVDAAPRTPGRDGPAGPAEHGYLHCGPSGAGHFVKMIHNGIEYGVMAAYAEGLNILEHAGAGLADDATDAETAPLRQTRAIPIPVRHPCRDRGVAARQRDRLLVARPHRGGLRREPDDGRLRRQGGRLGRGTLDGDERRRGGRSGAGAVCGAVRSLRQPGAGRLRQPRAVGDAPPVRRARREDG
jgi:6-phosphogluconate dehydrogenase (decarboxylating)